MKKYWDYFRKYDPTFLIVVLVLGLLLLILLFSFLKAIFVVIFFVLINILLRFYKRIIPSIPLEFEVITFGSLLCTIQYDIKAGIAVAILGSLLADIANGTINPGNFVMTAGYIGVAILGVFIPVTQFGLAGLYITFFYNIVIWLIFHLLFHHDLFKNTAYSITNLIFNYFLFTSLSAIAVLIL